MTKTRRIPTQARSREKYDLIIRSARELIGNKGNDSVSMREISKHSGVALASIYQYFPDKNTILQAIMEELFEQVRNTILIHIEDCQNIEELADQLGYSIDSFYVMFTKDPVWAILWAGLQANPTLMALDANDSKQNAELISRKVSEILGAENQLEKQTQIKIFDSTLMLVHMIGSTIRLALALGEDDGQRLIAEFKELVHLRLGSYS